MCLCGSMKNAASSHPTSVISSLRSTLTQPLPACCQQCWLCEPLLIVVKNPLRFRWTESPLISPQKSARESRPTQKKALESKCTLLSPQKRAPIFCLAPKRAQEIAQKSKSLKFNIIICVAHIEQMCYYIYLIRRNKRDPGGCSI